MNNDQQIRDPLTGVYSRLHYRAIFLREIQRARRENSNLVLAILDIDHFKSVNDAFGHLRGDTVLCEMVHRIESVIREYDSLFRYGGDEFLIILPGIGKDVARKVAQRLADKIRNREFEGSPPLSLTVSLGLADFPGDTRNHEDLFDIADQRLLEAKNQGRDRIICDDTEPLKELPFDKLSRLLERENEIKVANTFISCLKTRNRGILEIKSVRGTGGSRFLKEVGSSARMNGFRVLPFRVLDEGRMDSHGILSRAFESIGFVPGPESADLSQVTRFQTFIREQNIDSLLFIVDDLHLMNRKMMAYIRDLFQGTDCLRLGLVYLSGGDEEIEFEKTHCRASLELSPLSPHGIRIWLRSLLRWEPPLDFSNWLHRETRGLPSYVQKALTYLIKRGTLAIAENDHWQLLDHYRGMNLGERLGFPSPSPPNNLPEQKSRFIGRKHEIQEITRLLQTHRLITLEGAEGVGKTRLALQVAENNLHQFEDGVFIVPLASLQSPDIIIPAMAKGLNFTFYGQLSTGEQLINYLREKKILFVLDKFDWLMEGAEIICNILDRCPAVKIIVTANKRLGVSDEIGFGVKSMLESGDSSRSGLNEIAAVDLFADTAGRLHPGFNMTPENRDAIYKICRAVSGNPLAIELAAAWTPVLECQEIARGVEDILQQQNGNTGKQEPGILALIHFVWTLITEEEKVIIQKLTIFRGGFTRTSAEAVAGASLSVLHALSLKSLVQRWASNKFYLLETIRRIILSKLEDDPQLQEQLQLRHAQYFGEYILEAVRKEKAGQPGGMEAISDEIDNIRDGWWLAMAHEDFEILDKYIDGLARYFLDTGAFQEGEHLFRKSTEKLDERLKDTSDLGGHIQRLMADLLVHRGIFLYNAAKYEESLELFETGLSIYRRLKDSRRIAVALNGLGSVYRRLGNTQKAETLHEESLERYESMGDDVGVATTLHKMGKVLNFIGRNRDAVTAYRKSLDIFRKGTDRTQIANLLLDLGVSQGKIGDLVSQKKMLQESLDIRTSLNDQPGVAGSLEMLGFLEHFTGNLPSARQTIQKSLDLRRDIGDRWGMASSLLNLASIFKSMGEEEEALQLFRESLVLFQEIDYRRGIARTLNRMGDLYRFRVGYEKASEYIERGLTIFRDIDDRIGIAQCRINQGYGELSLDQIETSETMFRDALKLALEYDHQPLVLEAVVGLLTLMKQKKILSDEALVSTLGFAADHGVITDDTRQMARSILTDLRSGMDRETFQLRLKEGEKMSLEEILTILQK